MPGIPTRLLSRMTAAGVAMAIVAGWLALSAACAQETPWPAPVPNFKAPASGEHPRLLFRKACIAALRDRAKTPEGQAIIKRLRLCLNGGDGESMPTKFGVKGPVDKDGSGPLEGAPPGVFTFSHVAGFGMLYVLTGDKKYADLGRECMEKTLEGYRDRDQRYSFKAPYGALRAGPSLGWTALGYDLCYDGWDDAYRGKVAEAIQSYNEGKWLSLEELARGARQHPGSNHWGMEVGGAAMALLAIMNDPGADMKKVGPLLETSQKAMIRNMTEGFGDGGFFAEGDGTGSMSSHIVFLSALQAWKTAAGKDFYTPRPNAQWMALKWFFLTVPKNGQMDFPKRGAYDHNIWAREGISGGCYFGIGFGVATAEQRPAILWFYNHSGLKQIDEKQGTPFDTSTPYPHLAIVSFVNWPLGIEEKSPGGVIPHAYRDTKWGFYAWRNRWQDPDDIVISILTKTSKGNYSAKGEKSLTVWGLGKKMTWGTISGGFTGDYRPAQDGSTVLTTGDGSLLAIDFSKASGCDGMLVMTGPGAPKDNVLEAGGTAFSFLFLTKGEAPKPTAQGNKVAVGRQTVSLENRRIVLGVFGSQGM